MTASGWAAQASRRVGRLRPVLRELAAAAWRDVRSAGGGGGRGRLLRVEPGRQRVQPDPAVRVALYAHYARSGRVHAMVRRQLAEYARLGFRIVFVTMSPTVPPADWDAVLDLATLAVQRRSLGRDFGAWKDVLPELADRFPDIQELLLVNDSVLGPIRPLDPLLAALRARPPGLHGLTDSRQGPWHLQSYFLLATGAASVRDVCGFLSGVSLSSSRWLMVRRGEYGLTRAMQARGHVVGSLFDAAAVQAAAAARGEAAPGAAINPTHHGWRTLVEQFGFPFIKTDLLLRNPNRLRGLAGWPELVQDGSPVTMSVVASFLKQTSDEASRA